MRLRHLLQPRRWQAFLTRPPAFPDGHFHSPAVDSGQLAWRAEELWPEHLPSTPGIDWNEMEHRQVLDDLAPFAAESAYPTQTTDPTRFHDPNGFYEGLDARMLYGLLRFFRPARMIEVGSGKSTLLAADVNTRFLAGAMDFSVIERSPAAFLREPIPGLSRLINAPVQRVTVETFASLRANEILFLDSSHVAKTGSDVNHLYLQVLPCLSSGVIVHIRGIFLPWDYPRDWVLRQRRNWNEQYLLQGMLAGGQRFEVLFANHYASRVLPDAVEKCWGQRRGGSSIWLRVA
jgi:hypothetical protein